MTSRQKNPETTTLEETPRLYAIDLKWHEVVGRSLEELVRSRRCPTCQDELRQGRTPPTMEQHLERIPRHCSQERGYLSDRMPIMEIIFRILLRSGNAPKTAEEVHRELSAYLEARLYGRVLPLSWAEHLLEGANPYGIRAVGS